MTITFTSTVSRGQIDSAITITGTGYGKTVLGQTLIQEVIKENGQRYSADTVKYVFGSANIGGGVRLPMYRFKVFYRYEELGITYITSSQSGDTVSGIIFYPPFKGQTEKGAVIGKTRINSLDIPRKGGKISYSRPHKMGLYRDKEFSENANRYIKIDGVYYGYKKSFWTKNKFRAPRKTITEIRIGR